MLFEVGSTSSMRLRLELSDPGFDFTLLSDFRKRLIAGGAEQKLLDALLTLFQEHGWLTNLVKNSAPTPLTYWPRFEPSID